MCSGSTLLVYAGWYASATSGCKRAFVRCIPPGYLAYRCTDSAIGSPTHTMCVITATIVASQVNGPRRTADSGITTRYITKYTATP